MPFFSAHKRLFLILGLLLIFISVPLTVYIISKQQNLKQKAETTTTPGNDTCGFISVTSSETPSCPRLATIVNGQPVPNTPGAKNAISSYTTTYVMHNDTSQQHAVTYRTYSYFCSSPYGEVSPDSSIDYPVCLSGSPVIEDHTANIDAGQTLNVQVQGNFPNNNACGTVQTDFAITAIDGNNSCTYKGPIGDVGASGYCETGSSCSSPQPTITPIPIQPTNTPVPSVTPVAPIGGGPSATPTRTPTPTATRTPTPTVTLTPAPTIPGAPTATITPVPSNTPTPAPTGQPLGGSTEITSTPTPTPVLLAAANTVTPGPRGSADSAATLAPTGNEALVPVGIGMFVIIIAGLSLFFFL